MPIKYLKTGQNGHLLDTNGNIFYLDEQSNLRFKSPTNLTLTEWQRTIFIIDQVPDSNNNQFVMIRFSLDRTVLVALDFGANVRKSPFQSTSNRWAIFRIVFVETETSATIGHGQMFRLECVGNGNYLCRSTWNPALNSVFAHCPSFKPDEAIKFKFIPLPTITK